MIRIGKRIESEIAISLGELLAILLGAASRGRVDDAWYPITARTNSGGMDRRFGVAAIIFAVNVDDIGFGIARGPKCGSPVPTNIEGVTAFVPRRQLEWRDLDIGFRNRKDRPGAELWNAFRPRIELIRRDRGREFFLLL